MSDFLARLVDRTLGRAPALQPLVASRFGPSALADAAAAQEAEGGADGAGAPPAAPALQRPPGIACPAPGSPPARPTRIDLEPSGPERAGARIEDGLENDPWRPSAPAPSLPRMPSGAALETTAPTARGRVAPHVEGRFTPEGAGDESGPGDPAVAAIGEAEPIRQPADARRVPHVDLVPPPLPSSDGRRGDDHLETSVPRFDATSTAAAPAPPFALAPPFPPASTTAPAARVESTPPTPARAASAACSATHPHPPGDPPPDARPLRPGRPVLAEPGPALAPAELLDEALPPAAILPEVLFPVDVEPGETGSPAPTGAPADEPPVIHVHIGRIEVRAPEPPSVPRATAAPPPLSLDEYLRRHPR
jgi:hypothetical protein